MDIVKPKTKQYFTTKIKILFTVLILIVLLVSFAKNSLGSVNLAKKDLLIGQVKQGNLAITVDGYGKLVSEKLQLITSLTQATVDEIVLKPGAIVTKDSIIVNLANPELQLNVENAQQQLEQLKANLRQLLVNQKRELLTEQAIIAELNFRYEAAKLKRSAEQTLVEDGIVSNLTFKQSQLNENQLAKRIEILTERLEQLSIVHKEAGNIQKQRIKQFLGKLANAQNRLDKLQVRAGFDGVLQRLAINLGQSVAPGQEIALIGSIKELMAEIKVPQNQASQIKIGQKVNIDTRQTTIIGTVSRIDPIVEQNSVRIDVALPDTLPKNAKPQQNIDAEIVVKIMNNINYIERPANLKSQSSTSLYKLDSEENVATLSALQFGEKTGRFIEILSEVDEGSRYIISDLSNYKISQININ